MLLPEFKLSQNQTHVTVSIRVPYVKITACQFYIEANTFKFYLKPYLLNLGFQQRLKQMQQPSKAVYYHDKHILVVDLEKQKKGQYFQNLNLISSLISKNSNKKTKDKRVMVEVMEQKGNVVLEAGKEIKNSYSYGFCGNYTNVFKDLNQQCMELFMFDPATVCQQQRYELSRKIVLEAFDENAYMFDKVSNFDEIDRILDGVWGQKLMKAIRKYQKQPYTYEKFKTVAKIPKKQIIIDPKMKDIIFNQLISIAFSYIYEYACMEGDLGVESAKTINCTSAVFSCHVFYDKQPIQKVILDCCRRCVTYSLYKHIDICQKVCNLLATVLRENLFIQVLLDLRVMFEKSDPRYLLNRIYVDDYCTYVLNQDLKKYISAVKDKLMALSSKISEGDLDLQLQEGNNEDLQNSCKLQGEMQQMDLENLLALD